MEMTDIRDFILPEEMEKIDNRLLGLSSSHSMPAFKWLSEWNDKKQDLFKLFGNKLILEYTLDYDSNSEEIAVKMSRNIEIDSLWNNLRFCISQCLKMIYARGSESITDKDWDMLFDSHSKTFFLSKLNFVNNALAESINVELGGKTFKLQKGTKMRKVLMYAIDFIDKHPDRNAVLRTAGFTPNAPSAWRDSAETLILKMSVLLNDVAKHPEVLCLSIHPLDYMTMSDNSCGWSSCMNWYDGEYHAGTVEMMNSPAVIVAYLKSSEDFDMTCGDYGTEEEYWTNKKWRNLFIVQDDFIVGVKGYPYNSSRLNKIVFEKLKALSKVEYDSEIKKVNKNHRIQVGDTSVYLQTELMYNDTYGLETEYIVSKNPQIKGDNVTFLYSGQAFCSECGEPLNLTSYTICAKCNGFVQCIDCGEWINPEHEDYCFKYEGEYYCQPCYDNMFHYCDLCSEDIFRTDMVDLLIPYEITPEMADRHFWCNETVGHITFAVCPICLEDFDLTNWVSIHTNPDVLTAIGRMYGEPTPDFKDTLIPKSWDAIPKQLQDRTLRSFSFMKPKHFKQGIKRSLDILKKI